MKKLLKLVCFLLVAFAGFLNIQKIYDFFTKDETTKTNLKNNDKLVK